MRSPGVALEFPVSPHAPKRTSFVGVSGYWKSTSIREVAFMR